MNKKSILDMAMGAFRERADYEMSKVVDNILDPNTSATKRRSLTITMTFQPDSQRQNINTSTVVKAKLEPTRSAPPSTYPATKMAARSLLRWCRKCPVRSQWTAANKKNPPCYGW